MPLHKEIQHLSHILMMSIITQMSFSKPKRSIYLEAELYKSTLYNLPHLMALLRPMMMRSAQVMKIIRVTKALSTKKISTSLDQVKSAHRK